MHGLLASLRLPFALRGLRTATAAVSTPDASDRSSDAAARATVRTAMRPAPTGRVHETFAPRPVAQPAPAVDRIPAASASAPVSTRPIEPSVPVSAAHLVDPLGLRVVPFRPTSRWPLRRAAPRIYDPFRGFPLRSAHLADLMDGRAPGR